jgi:tetratricopeptide (TPR) repeat protein
VLGAAGLGKSRLAREFVAGVDARVADGRCLPYGEGITYAAVVDVVGPLGGGSDDLLAETPAAVPTIAALVGESQGAASPEEIAWAVRKLFEASASERPLVVVFDDVQWGEGAFLDLLEHMAYLSTGAPIMLLCLARPELLDRRPGWSTIALEPLAGGEVDELIAHLLQGEALDDELGAQVRNAAQGNPLFVEEMVAMVRDARDGEVLVPPTITALLAARLDQLEPAERLVLGHGSIEGELFHRSAVEALAPSARPVERELVALVRKDLVRPDRSPMLRDDAFRFRHLLIRDAAYDALPKATRAELHERFADWVADHSDRDELLGYHLEQAHRFHAELGEPDEALGERAAAHLVAAARRAATLSDFEAVAALLRRALPLGVADPVERVRVQFELGHALHQTRRAAEAEAVLTETHDHASRLGQDGLAALALVQRAWNRTGERTMDWREAQAVAERSIDVLTRVGDDRGLALARRLRGIALAPQVGHTDEVGEELERALAHAQACGDKEMRRLAIGSLANRYLVSGPTPAEAGIRRCEQLLDSVRGDRVLEATVKRPLAVFYAMAGQPAEANAALDDAALVLDELDLRTAENYRWVAAYARELAGDLAGAERELKRMFTYFRDLRDAELDTRARDATIELARLYCDERRWDEAVDALAYDPDATGAGGLFGTLRLGVRARLAAHEGLAEALPLAEQAVASAQTRSSDLTSRARSHLALAEVQRSTGLDADADASLAAALALFELKGNVAEVRRVAGGHTASTFSASSLTSARSSSSSA